MAHFAKVVDNKVVEVIVADQDFIDSLGTPPLGEWIQTSYNTFGGEHKLGGTPLRKNYAGIGYDYDPELDAFIPPQRFPSWSLNKVSCLWEPPIPYPTDGKVYAWDEYNHVWIVAPEDEVQ